MSSPVDYMLRDIAEAPLLFLLLLVPVALGAWAVRRGVKLGLVPIGTTVVTVAMWYLSYASDALPAVGGPRGMVIALLIAASGLLVAAIAVHQARPKAG